MAVINRYRVSLYEEAKAGIASLFKQTATVCVGFLIMLVLTGGSPSKVAVGLSFCVGFIFVAMQERKRLMRLYSTHSDILDVNSPQDDYSSLPNLANLGEPISEQPKSEIQRDIDDGWNYVKASWILSSDRRETILREACKDAFEKHPGLKVLNEIADFQENFDDFYNKLDKYVEKLQIRLKGTGQIRLDDWGFEMQYPLLLKGYADAFTYIREQICDLSDESVEEVPRQILYHHLTELINYLCNTVKGSETKSINQREISPQSKACSD